MMLFIPRKKVRNGADISTLVLKTIYPEFKCAKTVEVPMVADKDAEVRAHTDIMMVLIVGFEDEK